MTKPLSISLIIPVYNGGYPFVCCLLAITQSNYQNYELIVVNDGSTDRSALIAEKLGAKVIATTGREGPGAARNLGATIATGEYLCFIDADCEVNPQTLTKLAEFLESHPETDALFGSYDDEPAADNFVAQYKNLFHHYTHQHGREEASTFWAGFGLVKRSLFWKLDGFDTQRYPYPSIEDIDLGYRLKQAGGKIYLVKHLQVKHHKAWKLINLIKTDVLDRGIPWTELLLSNKSNFISDLNLQTSSRLSVAIAYTLIFSLFLACYRLEALWICLIEAILLLFLNWDVYSFFYQKRGIAFALKSILMHWLYYLYSGFAFLVGTLLYWQNNLVMDNK